MAAKALNQLTQAQRVPDLMVSVGYPFLKVKQSVAPVTGQSFYQGFWAQTGFTLPVFHNQGPEIQQTQSLVEQSQWQIKAVQQQWVSEIYDALLGSIIHCIYVVAASFILHYVL